MISVVLLSFVATLVMHHVQFFSDCLHLVASCGCSDSNIPFCVIVWCSFLPRRSHIATPCVDYIYIYIYTCYVLGQACSHDRRQHGDSPYGYKGHGTAPAAAFNLRRFCVGLRTERGNERRSQEEQVSAVAQMHPHCDFCHPTRAAHANGSGSQLQSDGTHEDAGESPR